LTIGREIARQDGSLRKTELDLARHPAAIEGQANSIANLQRSNEVLKSIWMIQELSVSGSDDVASEEELLVPDRDWQLALLQP